ncbi:hypothetical protein EV182_007593, partial [Spiromyces aspiralis]
AAPRSASSAGFPAPMARSLTPLPSTIRASPTFATLSGTPTSVSPSSSPPKLPTSTTRATASRSSGLCSITFSGTTPPSPSPPGGMPTSVLIRPSLRPSSCVTNPPTPTSGSTTTIYSSPLNSSAPSPPTPPSASSCIPLSRAPRSSALSPPAGSSLRASSQPTPSASRLSPTLATSPAPARASSASNLPPPASTTTAPSSPSVSSPSASTSTTSVNAAAPPKFSPRWTPSAKCMLDARLSSPATSSTGSLVLLKSFTPSSSSFNCSPSGSKRSSSS